MKYRGSCHCGAVAFEAEGELTEVMECNCSICTRVGALRWFVPRSALDVRSGGDSLGTYTFNRHAIRHRFCPRCGVHPFGEGSDPSGREMAAINARCLEDVDLASLRVKRFDGRAL